MPNPSLAIIILAAGFSRRLGTPKQLVYFRGKPLVQHVIETALQLGHGAPILVVNNRVDLSQAVADLKIKTLLNSEAERGIGASLKCGIAEALNKGYDASLVLLADQPFIQLGHLQRLITNWVGRPDAIVATSYPDGQPGVPCIIPSSMYGKIANLHDSKGAKEIIRGHFLVHSEALDESSLFDLDTPEDFRRLKEIEAFQS
jgi:molybdenum cofactor cytidylyltransferase